MNTLIKNLVLALICILCIQFIFAVQDPAFANAIQNMGEKFGVNLTGQHTVSLVPDSGGMFDNSILTDMHKFMLKTYKAMCKVLMVGHALMCYAVNVDYTCIVACFLLEVPNFNFLLVGLAIYIVGIFISMSIGMYFVDISFKIGFAIIFMPISIALWPFPPTKNKFADNLSIIIRNAMLFLLVAIGVSYCVKLITEGLFEGGEDAFWDAIANAKNEELTDSFSFFSSHILVVLFSLLYGFKILEGSVNNYLNAFFSDAAFGSESPMHHMGTQAVGIAYANTVKPAMSMAKDIATHQTGMAIAGLGSGLEKMATADGRQELKQKFSNGYNRVKTNVNTAARKTAHAITNPRETYNKAMAAAGEGANKAIQLAGKGVKEVVDIATLVAPVRESTRQKWLNGEVDGEKKQNGFNDWLDNKTKNLGDKAENVIAHGGGAAKEAAKKATAATGAAAYNAAHFIAGSEKRTDSQAVRGKLTEIHQNVNDKIEKATNAVEAAAATVAAPIKEVGEAGIKAGKAVAQKAKDIKQGVEQKVDNIKQNVKQKVLETETGQILAEAYNTRDQAPITLSPVKGIENGIDALTTPFQLVLNPVKTARKIAQNAKAIKNHTKSGVQAVKDEGLKKVIIKKGGQIVFRTFKDTKQDVKNVTKKVGENSAGFLGGMLKDFGHQMADNSARAPGQNKGGFDIRDWINADEQSDEYKEKAQEAAKADYFRSMGDD